MKREVLAYLHTHWDREWYKTFEEYRIRLCDILNDIFVKLDNNSINSFYLDGQTIALDDYLEIYPYKLEYVKNLIASKKLFIGPFYDLSDEFLVCGESLARNLLTGITEAKKYGADENDFIGYLPDAFGHNKSMPMLLNKANINKALVWRGVSDLKLEFLWTSSDDKKIKTTFLPFGYYQDFFNLKTYKNNLNNLLKKIEKYSINENMPILLPIGADHLACDDKIKAKIKNFNRNNTNYNMKLSSVIEYFAKTNKTENLQEICGEFRDNRNNYILPSVLSSRIYLKQMNMNIQWQLSKITEPLQTIMSKNNMVTEKSEILTYAWKVLIQNHAHDSICGCSLDAVHQENVLRYKKVKQISDYISDNLKTTLAEKTSKNNIAIVNMSNFTYTGIIKFYSDKKLALPCTGSKKMFPISISQDIHNIPVQENYHKYYEYLAEVNDLKGLSLNVIKPVYQKSSAFKIENNHIENEYLRCTVNNDGTINLSDKLSNSCFTKIFKITDEADTGDSYNFSCIKDDKKLVAAFKGSRIKEDNDLRKILSLKYQLNIPSHAKTSQMRSKKTIKHIFEVDMILYKASHRLDFEINYENFSKNHILKLNFEMPQTIEKVIAEDAFGITKRHYQKNYNYKEHLPKEKFVEVDLNTAPMQRFIIIQGLTIFTKGLQEYEADKNAINITMLRCFGEIAKKSLATRTAAAGPPLPTPEGECIGKQHAEFSLCLSDNVQNAYKEADFYYNPFIIADGIAKETTVKPSEYLLLPENLYLYSLKTSEDKNYMIAKIYNYSQNDTSVTISNYKEVFETDLLEKNINENNLSNKEIIFKQNELKILKIN